MADGSLSQFKATLARKKERDAKRRGKMDSSSYKIANSKPEYSFPKLSDAELKKVKKNIRKKMKREKRREAIFLGIVFLILVSLLLYLI